MAVSAAPCTIAQPVDTIRVFDDVLENPADYRAAALTHPFGTIVTGDEVWQGIALLPEDRVLTWLIAQILPGAVTPLTFFRQSPAGQVEPNFIHSDEGMGDWTAILYLTPDPPAEDGTAFWRYRPTGETQGSARALPKDPALWARWHTVPARFGRLLLFAGAHFHSRAIESNYGQGDTARLVQVAFSRVAPPPVPGTVIRPATVADIPRLVQMGQQFRQAQPAYAAHLVDNPGAMAELSHRLITEPDGAVFVAETDGLVIGMIGCYAFWHHFSGRRTVGELVFWVDPAHRGVGVRLLRQAERWAQASGATSMQLIAPIDSADQVGALYARLGYQALEVAYIKEWPACL